METKEWAEGKTATAITTVISTAVVLVILSIGGCDRNEDNARASVEIAKANAEVALGKAGVNPLDVSCSKVHESDKLLTVCLEYLKSKRKDSYGKLYD